MPVHLRSPPSLLGRPGRGAPRGCRPTSDRRGRRRAARIARPAYRPAASATRSASRVGADLARRASPAQLPDAIACRTMYATPCRRAPRPPDPAPCGRRGSSKAVASRLRPGDRQRVDECPPDGGDRQPVDEADLSHRDVGAAHRCARPAAPRAGPQARCTVELACRVVASSGTPRSSTCDRAGDHRALTHDQDCSPWPERRSVSRCPCPDERSAVPDPDTLVSIRRRTAAALKPHSRAAAPGRRPRPVPPQPHEAEHAAAVSRPSSACTMGVEGCRIRTYHALASSTA